MQDHRVSAGLQSRFWTFPGVHLLRVPKGLGMTHAGVRLWRHRRRQSATVRRCGQRAWLAAARDECGWRLADVRACRCRPCRTRRWQRYRASPCPSRLRRACLRRVASLLSIVVEHAPPARRAYGVWAISWRAYGIPPGAPPRLFWSMTRHQPVEPTGYASGLAQSLGPGGLMIGGGT